MNMSTIADVNNADKSWDCQLLYWVIIYEIGGICHVGTATAKWAFLFCQHMNICSIDFDIVTIDHGNSMYWCKEQYCM